MANMLHVAVLAVLAFSAQGRRVDNAARAAARSSLDRDKGQVNATGAKVEEMCSGIDAFAKYPFMEHVVALPDYLFGIFGDGLALSEDHQFMIFQARDKGSSKIGAALPDKTWKGLDYYFVKGPLCLKRCDNIVPKCCEGDASWGSTKLAPHGNKPSSVGKAAVLGMPWSKTNKFSPSGLGATFTFEALNGKVVAKGPSTPGGDDDCVIQYVHCCESNLQAGRNFVPQKFDIVGTTDGTPDGPKCLVHHD